MEKWVQLMVAIVSLLRVLLELPQSLGRWKEHQKKRGSHRRKRSSKG
ncbi:hypothetical protein [Desmospora activa]|uniref:Uncharacterized protein n=1 Tax=Desmospora activa DSM 45169 TaxID=1121389 RepID=A0A2T4Z512_9BACL|nr:hypothetical protein [Desmospora activa]PTM56935.1 hypothetical protein C8J48_3264 [Desmospora activa DSM 45169]